MVGLCACCTKGSSCAFRQPGTWVVECALFEQNSKATRGRVPTDLANHHELRSRERFGRTEPELNNTRESTA